MPSPLPTFYPLFCINVDVYIYIFVSPFPLPSPTPLATLPARFNLTSEPSPPNPPKSTSNRLINAPEAEVWYIINIKEAVSLIQTSEKSCGSSRSSSSSSVIAAMRQGSFTANSSMIDLYLVRFEAAVIAVVWWNSSRVTL